MGPVYSSLVSSPTNFLLTPSASETGSVGENCPRSWWELRGTVIKDDSLLFLRGVWEIRCEPKSVIPMPTFPTLTLKGGEVIEKRVGDD